MTGSAGSNGRSTAFLILNFQLITPAGLRGVESLKSWKFINSNFQFNDWLFDNPQLIWKVQWPILVVFNFHVNYTFQSIPQGDPIGAHLGPLWGPFWDPFWVPRALENHWGSWRIR